MNYLKLINYLEKENIYKLWNRNYGLIFPISKELLEKSLSNTSLDKSYVVVNEEKELIAFILYKEYTEDNLIPTYQNISWINLFLVDSKYRNKGIGSKLLSLVEEQARIDKKISLCLGRDCFNFFPGLPVDLNNYSIWFEKRGFARPNDTYDLVKNVNDYQSAILKIKNPNINYRVANIEDKNNLLEFLSKNWPGRWHKEAVDYFKYGGTGAEYIIGLDGEKICAFAKIGKPNTPDILGSYSLTWRNRFKSLGGIGPLGVNASYRGQKIGYDIVVYANNILVEEGVSNIIIDWTGLLDFYRPMGFEVFKSYGYMTKTL